jgi:hypothetical protein
LIQLFGQESQLNIRLVKVKKQFGWLKSKRKNLVKKIDENFLRIERVHGI